MSLLQDLSVLAVRQVLADRADSLLNFLSSHFTDHSRKLEAALATSSERAWRSLELALAGQDRAWWQRAAGLLGPRENRALEEQLRWFLQALPAADLPGDPDEFRRRCLAELQAARRAGLIPGTGGCCAGLADHARQLARFGERRRLLDLDQDRLAALAGELRQAGYGTLATYVALRPAGGEPLLVQAVRYFFRRAVEADPQLSAGLVLERVEGLAPDLHEGFAALHDALGDHTSRLAGLLDGVQGVVVETRQEVQLVRLEVEKIGRQLEQAPALDGGTRDEVRALRAALERQGQEMRDLVQTVLGVLGERGPAPPSEVPVPAVPVAAEPAAPLDVVEPGGDWQQVRALLDRCRTLPADERRPEVARAVGRLTVAARSFEQTRQTYLSLSQPADRGPGLPVYPPEQPDSAATTERTRVPRQTAGRLLSPLFTAQQEAPVEKDSPCIPEEPDSAAATERTCSSRQTAGRLLSPLFTAQEEPAGEEDAPPT